MQSSTKYRLIAATLVLLPLLSLAGPVAKVPSESGFNSVAILLIMLAIVLLFAIGLLASILARLAYVYRDKMRMEKKTDTARTLLLFIIFVSAAGRVYATDTAMPLAAPTLIGGMNATEFYLISGLIILELLVTVSLAFLIRFMVRIIMAKPGLAETSTAQLALSKVKQIPFWDRFHKAVAIEKEKDILLDHNYDGIRELDNSLPPWWKYGFYLTIVVGIIYLWYYHAGGNGPGSYEEYIMDVREGEAAKAAFLATAADKVDEYSVAMSDETGILAGKELYVANCVACHATDGGGGVGPNLTDDYWLHGGSIKDVFKSVKYGWTDKGMKSWKDDFSPRQIANIASFIKSLKGTAPAAPKEKQGDLYEETAIDTTKKNVVVR